MGDYFFESLKLQRIDLFLNWLHRVNVVKMKRIWQSNGCPS